MANYLVTGAGGDFGSRIVANIRAQGHNAIGTNRSDADLSEMAEINRFADRVLTQVDSLDGLVLNAGVAPKSPELSSEGFERTFAVNHLGGLLLAHRLLPLLEKSENSRIVLVGSSDHLAVRTVDMDALVEGANFRTTSAYAASKAVAMASMLEMARRLRGRVKINIADPGWARTGLHRQASIPIRILLTLGRPLQNSPEVSAKLITDLAVAFDSHGAYVGRKGPAKLSSLVEDSAFQSRCYEDTAAILVKRGLATLGTFLPAT